MAIARASLALSPLRNLSGVLALALICALYVGATERHETIPSIQRPRINSRLTRSHQRQVSRMHARLRAIQDGFTGTVSGGCFAATQNEAREKLIQSVREAEPGLWDPTTDFSSWLPSASSFVCTDGLRQEEVAGITAALNAHTHVRPRLSLNVEVENAPEPDEAHSIIQAYLGQDRYREHVAACLGKNQSNNRESNAKLNQTMTELLHLSGEQQQALKLLQARLTTLAPSPFMQALDEQGELVVLNEQPERDMGEELRELLSISELGFSILSEEQARAYREFATGSAYSEVLSQYKLTQVFLPIPEEIREMIKSNEELIRLNQAEEANLQETPTSGS